MEAFVIRESRRTYFIVIVEGHLRRHILPDQHSGFVGPCSRDVAHGVAAPTEDKDREIEAFHEIHTVGMASHAQVEAAKSIAGQAVAPTLKYNRFRAVVVHHGFYDRLKDAFVGSVVYAVAKREVDGIVFSLADADIAELTGAGKVLAIFVEGDGHDTVSGIERFFDAVAVVNVDVDVEDALLVSEEL